MRFLYDEPPPHEAEMRQRAHVLLGLPASVEHCVGNGHSQTCERIMEQLRYCSDLYDQLEALKEQHHRREGDLLEARLIANALVKPGDPVPYPGVKASPQEPPA